MHLIKVSAISSTNIFAREMFREQPGMRATCISAEHQLEGRGQRGSSWSAEPGKNLTISVVYPAPGVSAASQFLMSSSVAVTVVEVLEQYEVPKLMVKWPNDIMAGNLKIGGILIENIITQGRLAAAIIGLGLNVNQENFEGLPSAASIKKLTGREHDRELLLKALLSKMEEKLRELPQRSSSELLEEYKSRLFRMKIPSTFQLPDGSLFSGVIADVTPSGKLVVETEDEALTQYDLKEIRLCF